MSTRKTSVAIDEDLLRAAKEILKTRTVRETIERALREVLRSRARADEVRALSTMRDFDLDDPEVMTKAWRA